MSQSMNEMDGSNTEDEIDLAQLFHQVWGQKKLVGIITATCLLLSAFYLFIKAPTYKSDVILQVEEKNGGGLMGGDGASLLGFGKQNNAVAAESALIKSRFILAPVIENLGLDILTRPKQFFLKRILIPSKADVQINTLQVPAPELEKKLTLKFVKNGEYELYDSSGVKVLSGLIGKTAQNTTTGYKIKVDKFVGNPGQEFVLKKLPLSDAVDNINKKLSIEQLDTKKSETGLISLSLKGKDKDQIIHVLNQIAMTSQSKNSERKSLEAANTLQFLNQQLPISKSSLNEAELKLNKYRAETGKLDIEEQAKLYLERLSDLDNQLANLRIKKIGMSQRYTNDHPSTIAISSQIQEIEKEKYRMEKRIRLLPESDQKLISLLRDVKIKTTLYTTILRRIQEYEVMNAGTVSDVRILDWAQIPDHPIPGKSLLILLGSTIFGVMISSGYILGRRMLFPMVQDPNWTEKRFDLPNLAIVPFASEQQNLLKDKGLTLLEGVPLLAKVDPRALSIEGLRSLRTSLQINLSCAKNNIITIMGITPGVGKSFISSNLAYLLASSGKKVLIIDGDLRKGTVHQQYGISASPGFSELLQENALVEEVVHQRAHDNLFVMTRGEYPDDPSELLSKSNFKEIMQQLSDDFDVILIDTPPVLLVTDAMIIGALAATNYLIIGSDTHRPSDVEMAIKRIHTGGVTLAGTIFNCQTASSQISISHNKYYNSYYDDSSPTNKHKVLN